MNKWSTEDIGRNAWRRSGQPVIDYEDIPRTIPTAPAPLDAAHGCWETPQEPADQLLDGYARGIVSALLVGAIVAFVLVVTR